LGGLLVLLVLLLTFLWLLVEVVVVHLLVEALAAIKLEPHL
jgi:hypothetical protein